jgi:hypothetical protein
MKRSFCILMLRNRIVLMRSDSGFATDKQFGSGSDSFSISKLKNYTFYSTLVPCCFGPGFATLATWSLVI